MEIGVRDVHMTLGSSEAELASSLAQSDGDFARRAMILVARVKALDT